MPSYAADINSWTRDIARTLEDFNRGPRKSILRKGAAVIRKSARDLTPDRKPVQKSGIGLKPNPYYGRSKNGKRAGKGRGVIVARYHKGNLRRSIATLNFKRSSDVFIGPRLGKNTRGEIGRTISTANGYYAQMVFGGRKNFRRRVLEPALEKNRSKVRDAIINEARARISADFKKKRP